MTTLSPTIINAVNANQQLFTIDNSGVNLFQNSIANVSQADPAVVTVSTSTVISAVGVVGTVAGSGPWTSTVTGLTTTVGLQTGAIITATDDGGSIGTGSVVVTAILGTTSIAIKATGGSAPTAGTVTDITIAASGGIPLGLASGDAVFINGVGGMTQLTTAGANNTNLFYVDVVDSTSFELYRDANLGTTVDSTGFTTAVPNTGVYNTLGVPEYGTAGNSAVLLYTSTPTNNDVDASVAVDDTGDIGLNSGIVWNIICQVSARTSVPTFYKLVERDTGTQVGDARPIELPLQVTINTLVDPTYYNIVVYTVSGNNFAYPDQISDINLTVQAVAGYELPA